MKNALQNLFLLFILLTVFHFSQFEVLSGATVLAVTVTGLNYHAQTSTQHLETQSLSTTWIH